MSLGPGALLGLPPGFPDPVQDLAWSRYLLIGLAVLAAVLQARAQPFVAALGVLAFTSAAIAFWVLALGRPYGLFVDAEATRLAAEASVVATSGGTEGILAAGPPAGRAWVALGRLGFGSRVLALLPTFLPLLVVPAVALVVRLSWASRRQAGLAALLWLAFSTGDLDTVRGAGFVAGCWAHPQAAVSLVVIVAAVLWLGRVPASAGVALALALLPMAGLIACPAGPASLAPSQAALLLTIDQGLWLVLGGAGLVLGRDPASHALAIGGALAVIASAVGAPVDLWAGHGCYRLGLVLAATGPLLDLATRAGGWLPRWPRLFGSDPSLRAAVAVALIVTLPGSFLVWWDPTRLDPVARDSVEPLSPVVDRTMDWIRRETPKEAVFVASAEYAPHLAVLAGRRVLRAPSLVAAADDAERLRAERLVLSGRDASPLLDRFHLTHVFVGPGDFRDRGIRRPEDLEAHGRLRLRHADESGLTVYEIVRP